MEERLRELKEIFLQDGIEIVGIFGSVARGEDNEFSDIDIAYKINYEKFFTKYQDGFSQILRLNEMKEISEKSLKRRVDFVPFKEDFGEELVSV